jgi:ubiquinol-cytochrome c reductase cytochrome c1 subunit
MPNVLWELQGMQHAVLERDAHGGEPHVAELKIEQAGLLSPAEFDEAARDLTAFLQYVGEPAALQRHAYGAWVILFLAFFTFIAYLLKHEYWNDVH